VIGGIAAGCEQAGCALIGGETAEMPGMYPDGEYDLAGFAVGVVEKSRDHRRPPRSRPGDVVSALASSGPHSNGYSLVRRIVERRVDLDQPISTGLVRPTLMAPTRIYVKPVLDLIERVPVKGIAHITGGGLVENVPRVLPGPRCGRDRSRRVGPAAGVRWLQRRATSPMPRCTASSTAASGW
jgi:phosphoribosylformylglycinamidine cyclo-ligase